MTRSNNWTKSLFAALTAVLITTLGCGVPDLSNPDEGNDEGVLPVEDDETAPTETGTQCLGAANCGTDNGDVADPAPDTESTPAHDGTPSDEETPTPEVTPEPQGDPCDEYPWLKEAEGRPYLCGGLAECTLELFVHEGVCGVRCRPAFGRAADKLVPMDNLSFGYQDPSLGELTCVVRD